MLTGVSFQAYDLHLSVQHISYWLLFTLECCRSTLPTIFVASPAHFTYHFQIYDFTNALWSSHHFSLHAQTILIVLTTWFRLSV